MSSMKLKVLADSYPAPSKENRINEDQIYVNKEKGVFAVMDGLGGHGNGDTASYLAATLLHKEIENINFGNNSDLIPVKLRNSINSINSIISTLSEYDRKLQNFATTIALLHIKDGVAYTANVGDSSIYVFNEQLEELTISDSISLAKMSQCLGKEKIEIHQNKREIRTGDIYLLASDGLTDTVSNYEIEKILSDKKSDWKKRLDERVLEPRRAVRRYAKELDISIKQAYNLLKGKDDTSYIIVETGEIKWQSFLRMML